MGRSLEEKGSKGVWRERALTAQPPHSPGHHCGGYLGEPEGDWRLVWGGQDFSGEFQGCPGAKLGGSPAPGAVVGGAADGDRN